MKLTVKHLAGNKIVLDVEKTQKVSCDGIAILTDHLIGSSTLWHMAVVL